MLNHEHTLHRWGSVSHSHVKGLTCLGIRLSWAMLCSSMWCEPDLGEVCPLYVCLPSMEFMKELRDQTAADGVCLSAMLALLYPVGQYNWCFLSHQVSNSCCPAASYPSKCVCSARQDREGFWKKHWLTETQNKMIKKSFDWGLLFLLTPALIHYWYLHFTLEKLI